MGPCLLWTGSKTKSGYGQIGLTTAHRPVREYVHRIIWTAVNGPIPEGHEVHHRCEVVGCARPDHLQALTHREHMLATPDSVGAQHAARTVCGPCGGPYDEVDYRGGRGCRACRLKNLARYRQRKRDAGFVQEPKTRRWIRPETSR